MNSYLKLCANELNLKLQGMTNQMKMDEEETKKNNTYILNFEKMISELILEYLEDYKVE